MKTLLPHAAPYALYVAIGAVATHLAPWTDAIRIVLVGGLLVWWARRRSYPEICTPPSAMQVVLGVAAGLAVGIAWVPISKLWFASHGETARTGLDPNRSTFLTSLRIVDMVFLVPFAEELMVRSAVPRFVDAKPDEDWRARAVGVFTWTSAAASVLFFTFTHPEWLAALATGVLWTAVLARTKNLRVLLTAHAVANAWLAGHVLVTHETQWW